MPTSPVVYTEDTRPTFHWGSGVPSAGLGADGDGYMDITGFMLYGPKTAGAWGTGSSFQGGIGPTGETGAAGSSSAIEPGVMEIYAGITLPTGYLWANGASVARASYATLFTALTLSLGTCTMTIATPGVITRNTHGLVNGDAVYLTTTGALPTGLVVDTTYYVTSSTTNTFQLAATRGGAAINTTGSQSGVHTLVHAPWGGVTATDFGLPDMRGRVGAGKDTMGGVSAASRITGALYLDYSDGAATHTLSTAELPSHTHAAGTLVTASNGSHTHTVYGTDSTVLGGTNGFGIGQTAAATNTRDSTTSSNGAHTHTISGSTASNGSGSAHNNLQPLTTVNYIIKT